MRRFFVWLAMTSLVLIAKAQPMASPNGKLIMAGKGSGLTLSYQNQKVLDIQSVGFEGFDAPLVLKFVRRVNADYMMLAGKRLHCVNAANEFQAQLDENTRMVVRLYNDGLAFRYEYKNLQDSKVPVEQTAYVIPEGTKRWMQQWSDGYEGFFPLSTTANVKTLGGFGGSVVQKDINTHWGYPLLMEAADGVFALITEANIERRQSASSLFNKGEVFSVVPDKNELLLTGNWHTPWRVVIIGTLADVVQSTLVTDVSERSKLADTSWIKPGVVSWIYWAYNHGSNDYNIIRKYVDMAATLHLPYVLIDAEWDEMDKLASNEGKTIEDAVKYAISKGVKPLIWYNSSIGWVNGAPGPKFRLNKAEDREKEFAWCEKIGVAGVKIDFFSGDNQANMDYCQDLLESAARHHLLVNFHGAPIPRGWQRTYPNLLSTEGVYGAEWYNNVPHFTKKAASHNAMLPFTRNVIGPMDYTPCAFSDSQHPHITSNAHELALTVLFESGLQHLADRPESFLAQPQEVQDFLSKLPSVWDETYLISGYPGESVVMARRNGDVWYVAGINGKDENEELKVKSDKLAAAIEEGEVTVAFFDKGEHGWDIKTGLETLPTVVRCIPRGGFVFVVKRKPTVARIDSPDGKMTVSVSDKNGCPTYQVSRQGTMFIESSPLGLITNVEDLTKGLKMKSSEIKKVTDEYTLNTIKQRHVSYEATECVCTFEKDGRQVLDIIFRVSNRDVAYRYRVYPKRDTRVAVVEREVSGFVLPEGTTTFLCPQSGPMGGFARTSPSYETSYTLDDAPGKNGWGEGYTFPCLFKTPKGWVIISETGTDGDYVGCRLLNEGGTKYAIGFPQPGELNGIGSVTPSITLPSETPWRTLTLGETLANIVETTVTNDLVQPKYKASKDYTYGKGMWSWIIGMDPSCNFDEQKRYVDFAAAMGYRSLLVDALWDVQIGYEKMAELSRYAQSKGVGLFLWYNSNGSWNDAPQSPKGKMDKSGVRRQEMKWMQDNGILGIKVDFFGGDKQPMMQLYEDILTDANDFGLQVIFHGCTLPRGWERMYPNYVASEAVLASENLHFGQGACDAEARNGATHTFIRNTVGSMDFGGSALNKRYSADNQHGTVRKTSDVYALATAVLFQSSVQHFALAPNNLNDAPAWAMDFMRQVPTTWDEVRFIDGYPGKYAIIARRCGDKWYVAGINAEEQPLKKTVTLPMFEKNAQLTVYSDDAQLNGSVQTLKQNKKQQVTLTIPCNGGVVIINQ